MSAKPTAAETTADLSAALARAVTVRYSRSSGPGGQHANSSSTRAVASVVIAELELSDHELELLTAAFGASARAVSQDSRSQADNRTCALERLEERLRVALFVPAERVPTAPSPAALRRLESQKRAASMRKRDRAWRAE
jgi:ribosome-associated protein